MTHCSVNLKTVSVCTKQGLWFVAVEFLNTQFLKPSFINNNTHNMKIKIIMRHSFGVHVT